MIRTDRAATSPGELLGLKLGVASPQIRRALELWLGEPRGHSANAELCAAGDAFAAPQLVVSGWVGEVCALSDGRRQVTALRLPGDVIGLTRPAQPFATVALSDVQLADASRLVARLAQPEPALEPLRRAWAAAREAEQRRLVEHLVRLGRLNGLERTAHLLMELHERLLQVGLASPQGFHLPLTQEVLGDVLGLSIVHVNRTLQQLRRTGVAVRRSGFMTVLHADRLAAIAGGAGVAEVKRAMAS